MLFIHVAFIINESRYYNFWGRSYYTFRPFWGEIMTDRPTDQTTTDLHREGTNPTILSDAPDTDAECIPLSADAYGQHVTICSTEHVS